MFIKHQYFYLKRCNSITSDFGKNIIPQDAANGNNFIQKRWKYFLLQQSQIFLFSKAINYIQSDCWNFVCCRNKKLICCHAAKTKTFSAKIVTIQVQVRASPSPKSKSSSSLSPTQESKSYIILLSMRTLFSNTSTLD